MEFSQPLMEQIIRELMAIAPEFYRIDEPALTRNSFIIYMERHNDN